MEFSHPPPARQLQTASRLPAARPPPARDEQLLGNVRVPRLSAVAGLYMAAGVTSFDRTIPSTCMADPIATTREAQTTRICKNEHVLGWGVSISERVQSCDAARQAAEDEYRPASFGGLNSAEIDPDLAES